MEIAFNILCLHAFKAFGMQVITDTEVLESSVLSLKNQPATIGFVPTMGALHKGHLALVSQALNENDSVFVSIFVNPTQFNNPEDLKKYPRDLNKDVALLKELSKEIIVFTPREEQLYKGTVTAKNYDFGGLEKEMEGKFRPGHFDGVGTVLKLLFEAVQPDRAYFGEKDFQQLQIVKRMVALEKLPVSVIGCPIYREADGLALSSRNKRLTPEQRRAAPLIYKSLQTAKANFGIDNVLIIKEKIRNLFDRSIVLKLEYFEIVLADTLQIAENLQSDTKYRACIAVFAGDVRLIDTIALN